MDKFMDSPWFLRLTALALALILFFSVRSEQENKTKTSETMDVIRNVPVEVYYDKENLVVTGAPDYVDVTIQGPANLVQTAKLLKDFTVMFDLTNLPLGEHEMRAEFENISDKLTVRTDPSKFKLTIEEKITETFTIDTEINEQSIAEDYYVKSIGIEPKEVVVTGAKSVVESIEFVKVSITTDKGTKDSFQQKARIRVLDRDLNKLPVTILPEEASVSVEVEQYSKEVPLVLKETGDLASGITLDAIELIDQKVTIFGTKQAIEGIEAVEVPIDRSKITKTEDIEVKLALPAAISKLSQDKAKVKIKVKDAANPEIPVEEPDEE